MMATRRGKFLLFISINKTIGDLRFPWNTKYVRFYYENYIENKVGISNYVTGNVLTGKIIKSRNVQLSV